MPVAQRAIDYFARQAGRLAARIAPEHADETAVTVSDVCHEAYRRHGWVALVKTGTLECLDLVRQLAALRTGQSARITDAPGTSRDGARRPKGAFAMAFDDLKHALRRLRGHPGSALLATGMLGLAIGISSAMFTVFDALVLSPAPFKDAATLAWIEFGNDAQNVGVNLTRPFVQALRSNRGFAGVYAIRQEPARFGSGDAVEIVAGARITPGLLDELGVTPLLGRTFAAGEGRAGTDDLVILAETTWRSRFGADPAIVGKRVQISGAPLLVVGVLPASFRFPFFVQRFGGRSTSTRLRRRTTSRGRSSMPTRGSTGTCRERTPCVSRPTSRSRSIHGRGSPSFNCARSAIATSTRTRAAP
jgi:hypothetical protein